MEYNEVLEKIYVELPHLRDQLQAPKVVYVRSQGKVYLTFESMTLVEEASFLRMEKVLRRMFPQRPLALRVVSPGLAEDFLQNIGNYKQVLVDFLKRNYPASASWLEYIDWRCEDHRITLSFPDQFSEEYMGRQNVVGRLTQAVRDIFAVDVSVELTVSGDQENRLAMIREERRKEAERAVLDAQQQARISSEKKAAPKAERKEAPPKEKKDPFVKPKANATPMMPQMTDTVIGKPIMGRSIADYPMEMKNLTAESGLVVVQGDIFKMETKELKGGELLLVTFCITDYTSSIMCKSFMRYRKGFGRRGEGENAGPITEEERKAVMDKVNQIKKGMNVKVRGECLYDNFARELSISVRDVVPMEKIVREDKAEEKRVELHMHTNMSTQDALTPAEDLIGRAIKWGHPAVAITDHGVLQSFPAAFRAAKGKIKLIPGCEGYMVDEKDIVMDADSHPLSSPVVVLNLVGTGPIPTIARLIEVDAVKLVGGNVVDSFSVMVNPQEPLTEKVREDTGISDLMLADKETADRVLPKLMEFIGDMPIAFHDGEYQLNLLRNEWQRLGLSWQAPVIDTQVFARKLYPELKSFRLAAICKNLGIPAKDSKKGMKRAMAVAKALAVMLHTMEERGIADYEQLNKELRGGAIGKSWHIILLVKSQEGLVNLNRLVSISHLDYFRRRPHMPKRLIAKYREGLIIGSACEAGELYQALITGESWEKLKEIAAFYDYLEIQPIGNNAFMLRNGTAKDEEQLRENNRMIVRLGEEMGKPVVATGDVHFLDPHHAVNRAIIQASMGYEDCDKQPPLYFKTTDEMLLEFGYLGKEKAREVVITNPRLIADQVADGLRLFPKHPKNEDTFQPLWEDAADNIQDMTWSTAKQLYGDPLPEIVIKRLEKELKSIVGYGYCTLYNIAERLVSKSNEDGYLVGSRGSVGSSLVARMCGITEVNALPPHYRCIHCRKGFFDVDKSLYQVGVDLPDKDCPDCGQPLVKDGFDIPFEVFLGFEGDKVPDIDLNFSGEEQNTAHHYVEELFGHDHVFRAGTISGLADKTAFGYVSKYLEERQIQTGNTEKERLAAGCVGVKKTTGQHPGGMVVVPKEYEIYQFTAVQHPADDLNSDFTTTHFDFNSMHDILVKLDCLGHDDPTMLHMLEELTGVNYQDVPLDDPGVRTLFHSPEALGVSQQDIVCTTGTYGVPEFGTGFVRGMLDDTQPSTMEELLRISGLSHGTDVWLGNAQDLITSGTATLRQCVCCRDDIMNYLIDKGCPPKISFTTMESVRKGKGLNEAMVQNMLDHNIPDWFMDSCRKIKYMFPKGHAVAYVTMALRVAWFKLHFPAAYYATYFTVRGDGFNASTMLMDADGCREKVLEIRDMDKPTDADKKQLTCLELVLEMNMRGIHFLPVDLYKSDVKEFLIENGNIRCPFTSLPGLGESAAVPIVEARKNGPFLSVEDLKKRGRAGSSTIDLLRTHGSLEGMTETNQISMFGF